MGLIIEAVFPFVGSPAVGFNPYYLNSFNIWLSSCNHATPTSLLSKP